MEVCKELLSRASEIRSFYTVQGSYNRSGYVTRERVKLQADLVPKLQKRPLGAPRTAEGSFPWCKWKIAKKCSQRASEMRSFHIVQGSCKRSGWVSKVLMIDLKGNVSGPAQKKNGERGRPPLLVCNLWFSAIFFYHTHPDHL